MISLNLLVLRAKNPEELAKFYGAFGLVFEREQHGAGPVHYSSQVGAAVVEIYPCKAQDTGTSGTRLGFSLPCLTAGLEAAARVNAELISGPVSTKWGRRAVLKDPEGHRIELLERNLTSNAN